MDSWNKLRSKLYGPKGLSFPRDYLLPQMAFIQIKTAGVLFITNEHEYCATIDAFELWCWGRLLRVPWTARRSNQSKTDLKEISPDYSLEQLRLKLKLQYFGNLMWRASSLEKTLMLGKIEGRRRRGWQRMRWLGCKNWFNGHDFEQAPGDGKGQGSLACCSPWGSKELDMTEQLNNNNTLELTEQAIQPI